MIDDNGFCHFQVSFHDQNCKVARVFHCTVTFVKKSERRISFFKNECSFENCFSILRRINLWVFLVNFHHNLNMLINMRYTTVFNDKLYHFKATSAMCSLRLNRPSMTAGIFPHLKFCVKYMFFVNCANTLIWDGYFN